MPFYLGRKSRYSVCGLFWIFVAVSIICLAVGVPKLQAEWYAGDDLGYLDNVTVNGNAFTGVENSEIVFYPEDLNDGKVEIRGILESMNRKITPADLKVQISLNGGKAWSDATGSSRWIYTFAPKVNAAYQLSVRVVKRQAALPPPPPTMQPTSGTAGAGGIMTHIPGDGNSAGSSGYTGDPKDYVRAKGVAANMERAQVDIPKLRPVVAQLAATLSNNEDGDNQHWAVTIVNLADHEPLELNRYELQVVQLLDVPGQSADAGARYPLPSLRAGGTHGFSSGWVRSSRARSLRAQVWDKLAKTMVVQQNLPLPDPMAQVVSSSAGSSLQVELERPRVMIDSGQYLGRGVWRLQLKSNNMPLPAGSHSYAWFYRFQNGNDRSYNMGKDIDFPITAQAKILLETESFYETDSPDCAELKQIDIEITEKATGEKESITIPVRIPNIELPLGSATGSIPNGSDPLPVFIPRVINHSSYNLIVGYTLNLTLRKAHNDNVVVDRQEVSGELVLPANQSRTSVIIVPDMHAVYPNLQGWLDLIGDSHEDRDAMSVWIGGRLTINMVQNSLCGNGRPLVLGSDSVLLYKGGYIK